MDRQKAAEFSAYYQKLRAYEIAALHVDIDTLTEEARTALKEVIVSQKIDLEKILMETLNEQ